MITDEQVRTVADILDVPLSSILMRKALEAYEQSKWVSIDDRLPPLGEMVLAYRPNAHLSNDPHYKITFITDREQTSPTNIKHTWDCWCEVSHWMPLPEFKGD